MGSPVLGSLRISPPNGSVVSLVIPDRFKARLLTQMEWPSTRRMTTGLSGETLSRSSFVGQLPPANRVWSYSLPETSAPGGSSLILAATISWTLAIVLTPRKLREIRDRPPEEKWVWASISPGMTSLPWTSRTFVAGPDEPIDVLARSDRDDLSALAGDGFGPGPGVVRREDLAVLNDEVGFFRLPGERQAIRRPETGPLLPSGFFYS